MRACVSSFAVLSSLEVAAAAEGPLSANTPPPLFFGHPSVNQTLSGGERTRVLVYLCSCQSTAPSGPPICPPVHTSTAHKSYEQPRWSSAQVIGMQSRRKGGRGVWLHIFFHTWNPRSRLIELFREDNGRLSDGFLQVVAAAEWFIIAAAGFLICSLPQK